MPSSHHKTATTVEATVTSKGQVTLPSELRKRLGLQKGSRIRFNIPTRGPVKVEAVLYELEDLWKRADEGGAVGKVMTFEEMDEAKSRRQW